MGFAASLGVLLVCRHEVQFGKKREENKKEKNIPAITASILAPALTSPTPHLLLSNLFLAFSIFRADRSFLSRRASVMPFPGYSHRVSR